MVLQRIIGQFPFLFQFHSPYILEQPVNFVTSIGNCINSEFVLFHDLD